MNLSQNIIDVHATEYDRLVNSGSHKEIKLDKFIFQQDSILLPIQDAEFVGKLLDQMRIYYCDIQRVTMNHFAMKHAWQQLNHSHVMRAIEVALTGNHTVGVIGSPYDDYQPILTLLGNLSTFCEPCPCGNRTSEIRQCFCTVDDIIEFGNSEKYKRVISSEMIIKIPSSTAYTVRSREAYELVMKRVLNAIPFRKKVVDEFQEFSKSCQSLINRSIEVFSMTDQQIHNMTNVAITIAAISGALDVQVHHVAEAIQYVANH